MADADGSSPRPLPVISYRLPNLPPHSVTTPLVRRARRISAGYWLAQFACLVWLLMCASAGMAAVVEAAGGSTWPLSEYAGRVVGAAFAALPAGVLMILLATWRHGPRVLRRRRRRRVQPSSR